MSKHLEKDTGARSSAVISQQNGCASVMRQCSFISPNSNIITGRTPGSISSRGGPPPCHSRCAATTTWLAETSWSTKIHLAESDRRRRSAPELWGPHGLEEDKGKGYLASSRPYGNALLEVRHQEEEGSRLGMWLGSWLGLWSGIGLRLRWGGIFINSFIPNFQLSMSVKELWKSVNI